MAINSTLCYIDDGERYLMLLRNKKKNDLNEGKWIGVGGKFENDETPEECVIRETKEETGLTLTHFTFHGIVTFISDKWETEYMHLFTADGFEGELIDCNEGELKWIDKKDLFELKLWEGDIKFLKLLIDGVGLFGMKLRYEGDTLVEESTIIY